MPDKQPTVEDYLSGLSFTDLDEAQGQQNEGHDPNNPLHFEIPGEKRHVEPGVNKMYDEYATSNATAETTAEEVSPEQDVSTDAETSDSGEKVEEAQPEATEVEAAPETAGEADAAEPDTKVLSSDELKNIFIETNVYGEKGQKSLAEIQADYQKYMAGEEKLQQAKELMEQAKTFMQQAQQTQQVPQQATPEPEPDPYEDPTTREIRELKAQLANLQNSVTQTQVQTLQEQEDREVMSLVGDRDFDAVQSFITEYGAHNPRAGKALAKLFHGAPENRDHLDERLHHMELLLTKYDSQGTPQVIQKVAEQARQEGKKAAKNEAKEKLVNVTGGAPTPSSDGPSQDTIRKVAQSGNTDVQADFLLRNFPSLLGHE